MNEPNLIFDKLESLVRLSKTAETEYEKAALFGAISEIINIITAEDEEYNLNLWESIERMRYSAFAMLGYDIMGGHSYDQHFVWVLGSLNVIREKFAKK